MCCEMRQHCSAGPVSHEAQRWTRAVILKYFPEGSALSKEED